MDQKINDLVTLGESLNPENEALQKAVDMAYAENRWFTPEFCWQSLENIRNYFLQKEALKDWIGGYELKSNESKNVGLILAGNIPLVAIHDILCVFLSGHRAILKMSDKDTRLTQFFIESLQNLNSDYKDSFVFANRLENPDAVIATGSNTSAIYFEKYFSAYPNIIRRNRNGIAVLNGEESEDDLRDLGRDIFTYFGLGCRNVSKIYVPEAYSFDNLMQILHEYNHLLHHSKYMNNYDFNYATFLLNKEDFLMNGSVLLRKNIELVSRIACINYEHYTSTADLENELQELSDQIQCVVSNESFQSIPTIPFGSTQIPKLDDYADGVDTMDFLIKLN